MPTSFDGFARTASCHCSTWCTAALLCVCVSCARLAYRDVCVCGSVSSGVVWGVCLCVCACMNVFLSMLSYS